MRLYIAKKTKILKFFIVKLAYNHLKVVQIKANKRKEERLY